MPKFGDKIINKYASAKNPIKMGFFVKTIYRKGLINHGTSYQCTDGKGMFWTIPPEAVVKKN